MRILDQFTSHILGLRAKGKRSFEYNLNTKYLYLDNFIHNE